MTVLSTMKRDASWFVATRILSGLATFMLFALIGRYYPGRVGKDAYYFLFVLGFLGSTMRTLTILSAAIQGVETRAGKLRLAVRAFRLGIPLSILLVAFGCITIRLSGAPPVAMFLMWVCLPASSVDIDVIRAIVGKPPLNPMFSAAGALLGIAYVLVGNAEYGSAYIAISLQCLPSVLVNTRLILRLWPRIGIARSGEPGRVYVYSAAGSKALFDGVVLNAPFFLGGMTPAMLGTDLAVVMRIFVAAIGFAPLIVYWSNSGSLQRFAVRVHVSRRNIYLLLLTCSGIVIAAGCTSGYSLMAHLAVTTGHFICVILLLCCYAIYAASVRFSSRAVVSAGRSSLLVMAATTTLVGIYWLLRTNLVSVRGIIVMQCAGLLAGGVIVGPSLRK